MKKHLFTFLFLAKGKDICETVSFCLVTFLRKNIKDIKLIICDKIQQVLWGSC